MVYVRSFLVGMVAALLASVIYVLAVFVFPLVLPFVLSRATGSGGSAAVIVSSGPILLVAIIAFALGFAWEFRRGSRRRR